MDFDYKFLLEKIDRLEYHQSLLIDIILNNKNHFHKLIIEKSLNRRDVEEFYKLCEEMSIEMEKQKAEGFVYFHPLFEEFKLRLHPNLHVEAVIRACLSQQIYEPLMKEFKNYL